MLNFCKLFKFLRLLEFNLFFILPPFIRLFIEFSTKDFYKVKIDGHMVELFVRTGQVGTRSARGKERIFRVLWKIALSLSFKFIALAVFILRAPSYLSCKQTFYTENREMKIRRRKLAYAQKGFYFFPIHSNYYFYGYQY